MNNAPTHKLCECCGEMFDESDPYVLAFHQLPAHVGIVRINRARKASIMQRPVEKPVNESAPLDS